MKETTMYKMILLLSGLLTLSACDKNNKKTVVNKEHPATSTPKQTQQTADELYQLSAQTLFKYRPIAASQYGVSEKTVGFHYQNKLDDYSPKVEQALRKNLTELAQKIHALKIGSTDVKANENKEVMENISAYYAGDPDFSEGYIDSWMGHSPFIVNQINGPMIDVPNFLINNHAIHNIEDANDYIERLNQFDSMANSVLLKLDADAKKGWIPPKVILKKASKYLHGFTKTPVENSTLLKALQQKIAKLDLDKKMQDQLTQQCIQAITNHVYPAFKKVASAIDTLIPNGKDNAGIWAQPNGEAFYRYEIKQLGDSDLTPQQIHQIGLDEVKRITTEMDKILVSQGYDKGTVGERMVALSKEPRFLYPNDDKGRAQLLQDLNGIINQIKQRMPEYFKTIPPYDVVVKRIPIATQDSSGGGYYTNASLDGKTPGMYWINLRNTKANPKFDLKTLSYHEAIPGHHWQISVNLSQKHLPLLRRLAPYNAYVEGWALYSEHLAYEMGMYKDDPFGNLGRLKAELFRAVRLVVDTGIHAKKWTREQAIDYMAQQTGNDKDDVVSEIERYMNWPGQALGYKLGMLKILSLRDFAKKALGADFDIQEFHEVVLNGGARPMKVLDESIRDWVKQKQSAKMSK